MLPPPMRIVGGKMGQFWDFVGSASADAEQVNQEGGPPKWTLQHCSLK